MRKYLLLLCIALLIVSCGGPGFNTPDLPHNPGQPADSIAPTDSTSIDPDSVLFRLPTVEELTLREKVGQLFNIRPEDLRPGTSSAVVEVSGLMRSNYKNYPCGGFTLFAQNVISPRQLTELTDGLHKLANYPMLCIDEEGGNVARIGNNNNFSVTVYANMFSIGQTGDPANALSAGRTIGEYLYRFGLDVDFAPVADVWTNPQNTVIGKRAFGTDAQVVASMTDAFRTGLNEQGIIGCYKHFPGHGNTSTDSHYGYASTGKSWREMQACELIPFQHGIDRGIRMIMAAHISCPNVTQSDVPTTMSHLLLTEKLREEMGFEGVVITDGMGMGAITQQYPNAGDAAVAALEAGADIILLPADYFGAFNAVVRAVEEGRLTEERIDASVRRVLALKQQILTYRNEER